MGWFHRTGICGLSNFVNIFTDDPYFLKSIGNTLLFMLFNAPFVLIGGLNPGYYAQQQADSRPQCFQLATFLPYLTIPVAIGVLLCCYLIGTAD